MKIGVVVPIVGNEFIGPMLQTIKANTVQPAEILVIDNREDPCDLNCYVTQIMTWPSPRTVNESWNYGIDYMLKKRMDLISVFNDDILLEKFFFEKMTSLAGIHEQAGVFCPETVKASDYVKNPLPVGAEQCIKMKKREGWAWTIRGSIAEKVPPIPQEIATFCGDDWYWFKTARLGIPWMKMKNTWCFHYVGRSMKITSRRQDLSADKAMFKFLA